MNWDLESIAYGESVRKHLKSDYIYEQYDCMSYAVFVDEDTECILLKPTGDVDP